MGHLHVDAVLSAQRSTTVRMLVDTGATYSFVPDDIAVAIGAPRLPERIPVKLADGTVQRLEVGLAKLTLEGREAAVTLVIGAVVEPLLGVEALESLGLARDPQAGRLVPTRAAAALLATMSRDSWDGGRVGCTRLRAAIARRPGGAYASTRCLT